MSNAPRIEIRAAGEADASAVHSILCEANAWLDARGERLWSENEINFERIKTEVARGLCNYSAIECRKIARKSTKEIEPILGYVAEAELIHRDNMVLV